MQQDPQRNHVVNVQQHVGHGRLGSVSQVVDGHRLPAAHFDDAWGKANKKTRGKQGVKQGAKASAVMFFGPYLKDFCVPSVST